MPAKKTSSPNSTKITSQSNRYSILQSKQFNKDYVTITNLTKKPLEHSKTWRTIPNLRKSVSNSQTPSKAENYSTVNSKTTQRFKVKIGYSGIIPSLLLKLFCRFFTTRFQKMNFCVSYSELITYKLILDSFQKK